MIKNTIIIFNLCHFTFAQAGIMDVINAFFEENFSIYDENFNPYKSDSSESEFESEAEFEFDEIEEEPKKQDIIIDETKNSKPNFTDSTLELCDHTINDYLEKIITDAIESKEAVLPKIIQEHSNEAFWPLLLKAALNKKALSYKDFLWILAKDNKNTNKIIEILFSLKEDFSYLFKEITIAKNYSLVSSVITNYMKADSYAEQQNLLVYLIENSHNDIFSKLLEKFPKLFEEIDNFNSVNRMELVEKNYEEKYYTFFEWLLRKEQQYLKLSAYANSKNNNYVIAAKIMIKYVIDNEITIENKRFQTMATTLLQEKSITAEDFDKLKIAK